MSSSKSPKKQPSQGSPALSEAKRLIDEGLGLRQSGDHAGGLALYRQAVALPNAPLEAFFNLGNALFDDAKFADAKGMYLEVLSREPELVPAILQLARCEVRLGAVATAREAFAQVLRLDAKNYSAWLEAGHLCRQQGLLEQMLVSYRNAVAAEPSRWQALLMLARGFEDVARFDEAAVAYHRAILCAGQAQKTPSEPLGLVREVHWMMARYRLERGDFPRALEAMRQAMMALRLESAKSPIEINERAEMQIDLGDILFRLGMHEQAHRVFESASLATSESTLVKLAEISFRYNLWMEAQDVLKRNVALNPNSALAHWNLAHSYAETWQIDSALAQLAKAEAIAPQPGAKSMRASIAGRLGDVDEAYRLYCELADEEHSESSSMRSSAAMSSLYSDKLSAADVAKVHQDMFAPFGKNSRKISTFKNSRDAKRPLKLGFVSADFHHQHPVNIFMQPILARMNKDQFEISIYFTGVSYDEETQRAKNRVKNWVVCSSWNDAQLAAKIEADGIDVLVDLSGHTSHNRVTLFAQRAAPVQASFLGYPASTGVPNIDWLIADSVVAPEGSDDLFSERVMRLPDAVFCYAPEMDYPFPTYTKAMLARPPTFGSFNNVAKLTEKTIKLWSEVIKSVPGSRMILKAPSFKEQRAIDMFIARFENEGVTSDRLEFRGPVGLTDMMAEYADVDVALDPLPYNGGTTTLQALWMGVPVVVKAGGNFVSRMGSSFMQASGMQDWVAHSDQDYINIAVQKIQDRAELLKLKSSMRQKLQDSPAWSIDKYVRDVEHAVRLIWTGVCQ